RESMGISETIVISRVSCITPPGFLRAAPAGLVLVCELCYIPRPVAVLVAVTARPFFRVRVFI
ncbi:hypothetical protein, partial [Klebsiella pneumoniae]|uniref:hypothetical protein n=1 Tax=Klebsiella pneumoniae TaxID=573 RepID=UPI00256F2555